MRTGSWMKIGLLAAAIAASGALAQGGPPPGAGTGGYGPGMMGGGYGPGMMGGYGPGMMGGMNARGMGGPGIGGYAALDLTDEQRQKLAALGEQARGSAWDAMGKLRSEQFKLRELLRADPVNVSAVIDQQAKDDELRRQVLKSRVEARNEMAAVLTPEQRRKLRDTGPWWYREDAVE